MPPAHSPALSRARLAVAVFATVVLLTLVTVLTGCSSTPDPTVAVVQPTASGAPETERSVTSPDPAAPAAPAAPAKVAIPSVGITSSLMELGLNPDGTVEVPPAEKGMTAGWYTGGAVPGQVGAAVIIGHNDTHLGRAVFHDLKKITKGADITVTDASGKAAHFSVTATESVSKTAFPTEKVYGPTQDRALRLITCDGDFDAQGHPVDNLIVYATLS
ncbi:class F sortase [Streptomyces turgidiscabies]|uniref:Sortase family protein n=1 Tax=Streptomyces turgidiscabies (strain Car8) TaxID=698760 RepID=L7F100_STRT8|nr:MULTISPECIES: class F sortase [Streptomyces]ELP64829.1 sortase family protein [Streptomyces turgidiscabies Car8]MDX3494283.1 class F sortase [Streptomyces turgidiscabies]GAQ68343.1 sortase family protein [Streptomyces turgidiscabies]